MSRSLTFLLALASCALSCSAAPQRPANDPADPRAAESPSLAAPGALASASPAPTASGAPAPANPHAGHTLGGAR